MAWLFWWTVRSVAGEARIDGLVQPGENIAWLKAVVGQCGKGHPEEFED